MDLLLTDEATLPLRAAKIDETSLALPCSTKQTLSLKYKLNLAFPWFCHTFAQQNPSSGKLPAKILILLIILLRDQQSSRGRMPRNKHFNVKESFLKIFANFNEETSPLSKGESSLILFLLYKIITYFKHAIFGKFIQSNFRKSLQHSFHHFLLPCARFISRGDFLKSTCYSFPVIL